MRFIHPLITGASLHAFDDADLVDGGQDKQIDIITIDEEDDTGTVYLIQAKNTNSFSSNVLIQMRNGLNWVFAKPKHDVETLANTKLRDKIVEFRSLWNALGPSNLHLVTVFAAAGGDTSALSDEFKQEASTIRSNYDNGTFEKFELLILGSAELNQRIAAMERRDRTINADMKMRFDASTPSTIKYDSSGLKGLVCSVAAKELARIVNQDKSGFIFDSNIRRFLGSKGGVNSDIHSTCSDGVKGHLFWFLNNGITIACDSFDLVQVPENHHVKLKNMQIVNGCQTATTIARAAEAGSLQDSVHVLVRVYETSNNLLVDQIVRTTNNQNRISSRDLHSNDRVQLDMENGFAMYDLLYERKPRQYDSDEGVDSSKIVPNELVAQSYLAIVMGKPADARRRKHRVWDDYYQKIFDGGVIEPYVFAYWLHRRCLDWLTEAGKTRARHSLTRKLANNGVFHIARIAGFKWRRGAVMNDTAALKKQIRTLQNQPGRLNKYFDGGIAALRKLVRGEDLLDMDDVLKSPDLDAAINAMLYRSIRRVKRGPKSKRRKPR